MYPYFEDHEVEMMEREWKKEKPGVSKEQRRGLWENFGKIRDSFRKRLENDKQSDVLDLLRDAIWEGRQGAVTGKPRVRVMENGKPKIVPWSVASDTDLPARFSKDQVFTYASYKQACADHPEVFVQWDLDTHHDEVKAFAPELGNALFKSAERAGKTPPMERWQWDAMVATFSIHDELKWCAGPDAQFAFDHKHMPQGIVRNSRV